MYVHGKMGRAEEKRACEKVARPWLPRRGAERGTPQSYVKAGSALYTLSVRSTYTSALISPVCAPVPRPRAISHIHGRVIATRT